MHPNAKAAQKHGSGPQPKHTDPRESQEGVFAKGSASLQSSDGHRRRKNTQTAPGSLAVNQRGWERLWLTGQPGLGNLINHVEVQSYEFPQTNTTNCSVL